jgi:hypothetical protein
LIPGRDFSGVVSATGALYILAGFVTFGNPLLAAALLTLVLGATLVASGIMRIVLALLRSPEWFRRPWPSEVRLRLVEPSPLVSRPQPTPQFVPVRSNQSYRGLRDGIAPVDVELAKEALPTLSH